MISDSIPILDINTLNNEFFLAINRIRHLWRQRAGTNQSKTKDFLQDDIHKVITDEKSIYKINSDKNSYKVYIELIDEKDQSFLVFRNDFPAASIIIPINKKTLSIDFILLNTNKPKNHKPINNDKKTSKLKKFI